VSNTTFEEDYRALLEEKSSAADTFAREEVAAAARRVIWQLQRRNPEKFFGLDYETGSA
jgi:hypothetical protein